MGKYATKNTITWLVNAIKNRFSSIRGVTTGGDGAAYTATVDGISVLEAGVHFMMIPHTVSTSTTPTLDVNGLGAKELRCRLSGSTGATITATEANWLESSKPVMVTYDGSFWIVDIASLPPLNFSDTGESLGIGAEAPDEGLLVNMPSMFNGRVTNRLETFYVNDEIRASMDCDVPSVNTMIGGWSTRDADDRCCGYSENILSSSGNVYTSLVARKYSSDGSTAYNNGLYLQVKPDGSPYVSFAGNGTANAWLSAIGAAASSHNHSAANITSGTLPIARGGTGATSANGVRNAILGGITAYVSSQKVVTTSAAKVTCGTQLYKHGSNLELSGGGIKCLQAGTVLVGLCGRASYVDSWAYIEARVYKNSSNITTFHGFQAASDEWFSGYGGCVLVNVAANDIIYFYARTNSGECTLLADQKNTLTVAYI